MTTDTLADPCERCPIWTQTRQPCRDCPRRRRPLPAPMAALFRQATAGMLIKRPLPPALSPERCCED